MTARGFENDVLMGTSSPGYQLGHDVAELERLNRQGSLLAPATRTLLSAAGIGPGMRVLDLGSGAGDVSFLVAEIVGADGEVVGVERSPEAVATAVRRARYLGLENTSFLVGDIRETVADGVFDAITGRLVLMYLPDPAAALRTQATLLRPGGVVAPIEFDLGAARSLPAAPLMEQALAWLREAFQRAGIQPSLGARLWAVLGQAGLTPLGMLGAWPHYGPGDPGGPALLAGIVRTLLPVIERTGVATLEQRLANEMADTGAVFAHPPLLCAWGTRPQTPAS
jgi:SAM-dependent methyltransferase